MSTMTALPTPWRLLLACLGVVQLVFARGKLIDIFNEEKSDILQLRQANRQYHGGKFYNAIFNNSDKKWDVKDSDGNIVIPYIITGQFDPTENNIIKEAMRLIEDNTCIRFMPRTSQRDYIDIHNVRNSRCYTSVGRQIGKNILMLETNEKRTCVATSIVQHELLHVIGLWHEQMRYDRDQYVKVLYQNIQPGSENEFDIVSEEQSTVYDVPYDYKSLLHYPKTAFAKPGLITIETLDPAYMDVIGQQNQASPSDYQKVCNIYGCQQYNGITTDRKECSDSVPRFCAATYRYGLIDCGKSDVQRLCCDTCNAANSGSSVKSNSDQ